jgi:cysteine desulfurase / selenocysteine lyase
VTPGYDLAALRKDQFPVTARWAYVDNATFGPPPRATADAVAAYVRDLSEVPRLPVPWSVEAERVRQVAARFLGCAAGDLAFLKSSAEAMGLVALGLDWGPGDEVVVPENEFPAGVLPWLHLAHRGVRVRFVPIRDHRFDAGDVEALVGERTRAVCVGLVNFGTGFRAPVERIAEVCRRHGAWLLVDATQAAGVLRVDATALGCHLLAAHGYKFLLAGHGTAPCYVDPELRACLRVPEPGWKTRPDDGYDVLTDYTDLRLVDPASRFEPSIPDVSSIVGLGASMELLLVLGRDEVERWAVSLAARAAAALRERGYDVASSDREGERSGIVSATRAGTDLHRLEADLLAAGVVAAVRENRLRLSFHGYNDESDLERLLAVL